MRFASTMTTEPAADRYRRQTLLPEIGVQGQRRLAGARVLCVGAGGLGCAALPYLAGAGIGLLTIADDDRVERSNLHRQVLFGEPDLGQLKAEAAARRLRALNPEIAVQARAERVDAGNVEALLRAHDVVIDGSDNFESKFLLSDASAKFGVPLVYGSATGMEAMVTVLHPGRGPCLRCLFPEAPRSVMPNCAQAGVLGPLVGMVGSIQAAETIKLLVGGEGLATLAGTLWVIDARDMGSRQLRVQRRAGCVCQDPAAIALDRAEDDLTPVQAQALCGALFVDVRSAEEYAAGHIHGALHLPLERILAGDRPDPGRLCVLYCQHGSRSAVAVCALRERGVGGVRNLRGGLRQWKRDLPPETP